MTGFGAYRPGRAPISFLDGAMVKVLETEVVPGSR